MKKRGQVTVFIIVGIVLLTAVGLYIMIKEDILIGRHVPKEISPIAAYTRACIQQVAEDGLFLQRLQGGYIELPEKVIKDNESYVDLGFKLPFWLWNNEDRRPSLERMEKELNIYVAKNLNSCLNNFENFKNEYSFELAGSFGAIENTIKENTINENIIKENTIKNTIENANIAVTSSFNKNDVTVDVAIPITLQKLSSSANYEFPELDVEIPTKIRQMYELSSEIMLKENTEFFIEEYVNDMIASSDYLPHEGMEITCEQRKWKFSELEDYSKQMIMHNIHFLTFKNTKFTPSDIPYFDKLYRVEVKNSYPDLEVNTIYNTEWPLHLSVHPSHDSIVKPIEYTASKYFFNCFKIYHHKYSLNFPMLFQIISDDNPDDIFYFATPVIIDRDVPNRYSQLKAWPGEVDEFGSGKYCTNTTTVSLFEKDEKGKLVLKPQLKENRQVTLNVYAVDAAKGYPDGVMNDVTISYHCVKFRCGIGKTSYPVSEEGFYTGALPVLSTKFPYCVNGYLIAEKDGYITAMMQQSVEDKFNNANVNIEMKKLKEFSFDVRIIQEHVNIAAERELLPEENVMISLRNEKDNLEQVLFYPLTAIEESEETYNVETTKTTNVETANVETNKVVEEKDKETETKEAKETETKAGEETETKTTGESEATVGDEKTETGIEQEKLKLIVAPDTTYELDLKLIYNDNIWAGAMYNWTPSYDEVVNNNRVTFYIYKKDALMPPQTPEQFKEMFDYSLKQSSQYKPKIT